MGLIKFQEVYRDAIQSLMGTNPSAAEITAAHPNAVYSGISSIQTGGGTFFDLFARKGRNEWEEVQKVIEFYRNDEVQQSALIRGDFLFSYEPQPFDVVKAMVMEYARMGMNVLQNFHGLNDTDVLAGVAEAVRIAREEEGHNIVARGTLCVEDNRNIRIDELLFAADKMVEQGHTGFYIKSASGRMREDTIYRLTAALMDRFDGPVGVHAHSTYGEAPVCYMAAIEAAIERGREIEIDIQHPALSGSTAHPSMLKMAHLIRNHPNQAIRGQAPILNIDAIKADMDTLYVLRFLYRESESEYDKDLLRAMYAARAAGGATSALKAVHGLEDTLSRLLGTNDWTEIQKAIYAMQAQILPELGDPTQITPYAANTNIMAAVALMNELNGKGRFDTLPPGIVNYLVGRHGRVPESVNRELQARALEIASLTEPVRYVPSQQRDDALPAAIEKLKAAGIEGPTARQAISAHMLKPTGAQDGVGHVVACHNGENTPQMPPELPHWAKQTVHTNKDGEICWGISDTIAAIGGVGKIEEMAQRALHLKQIDDHVYIFPQGEKRLEQEWREGNLKKMLEFFDGIPAALRKAGMTEVQLMGVDWRKQDVMLCLKDACDHKAKGLFDYMVAEVEKYRQERTLQPAPKPAVAGAQLSAGRDGRPHYAKV